MDDYFKTDLTGLKKLSKEWFDAIPKSNFEQIQAGFKCLMSHYFTVEAKNEVEEVELAAVFRITKRIMDDQVLLAIENGSFYE